MQHVEPLPDAEVAEVRAAESDLRGLAKDIAAEGVSPSTTRTASGGPDVGLAMPSGPSAAGESGPECDSSRSRPGTELRCEAISRDAPTHDTLGTPP